MSVVSCGQRGSRPRRRSLRRLPRPTISFRVQTLLIVALAVAGVSTVLIGIQAQSIRERVLDERASGIERVSASLQESANYAASSGGRAYLQADLRRRLPDIARQIGADAALISGTDGAIIARSDPSSPDAFQTTAAEEVLRTGKPVMQFESPDALVYALPFRLAGDERGVFASRISMQPLTTAIADATTGSILPSILVLLIALPLAAFVSNRILARSYEREQQLRVEARLGSLVRNSSDLILIVGVDGRIHYASPSVERVLGFHQGEVQGHALANFLHVDDLVNAAAFLAEAARASAAPGRAEWRIRQKDDTWRDFEMFCANLTQDASVAGLVLNGRDVSERKMLEEQLAHQAFHDPLTKLANRALFQDRLDQALGRLSRRAESLAVLFLDLDDFKTVNDSLGHHAGDELLVAIAERLSAAVRTIDTVARLGGDEFAILLEEIDDATLQMQAERITHALRAPFTIEGQRFFVTASVGIASSSAGLHTTQELLRGADVAMYAAKNRGNGRVQLFDRSMHQAVVSRLNMDSELRSAMENGEFRVHYQPVVQLRDRRVVGLEALIRWQHPERGLITPEVFIQLAEDTGVIHEIGRFILDAACRQTRTWQTTHRRSPPLSVSVNLSAGQIQDPGIVKAVAAALGASGLPPASLILEITETVLMEDTEVTLRRLVELKALGVRLAIDDFGTGYSSLSYLRRFPVDILKIDRSFVDNVAVRTDAMALCRAIVDLGSSLGLQTIAEGVEHSAQADELMALGCDMGQGYLFARPSDATGIEHVLDGSPRPVRAAPPVRLQATA